MDVISKKIPPLFKTDIAFFIGLGLLITALYGSCLRFDFVSYDDDYHVYHNLSIREFSWASAAEILTGKTRVLGDAQAQIYANRIYIPLTFFSFQAQYALTGLNPMSFHAGNLLLFLLIVFLVYRFLFVWLKNKPAAALGALLFAVHPLNTEPVVWVSGRKDLLSALFFIQGLLLYKTYAETLKKKTFLLAFLCCFLSVLAKPSGGILIAVLVFYDALYRPLSSWKRHVLEKTFFLIPVLLPVLFSLSHYGLKSNQLIVPERLLFAAGIPFFALGHAFIPAGLSAFYPYPNPLLWSGPQIMVMFAGLTGLAGLWRWAQNSSQDRSFALAFFFITLLPYVLRAAFFSDGGFTSDRYMLLPLLGLCLLAAAGLKHRVLGGAGVSSFQRKVFFTLAGGLILILGFLSHTRASVWNHSETLALDIIKKYPEAANAQEELGRIYQERGQRDKATAHFKNAYLANPSPKRLIQFYEHLGLNTPLVTLYQKQLRDDPQDSRAAAGLGMVYFRLKLFSLAEPYLRQALRNGAEGEKLYNVLAGTLYYQGKTERAITVWQQALAINPNDAVSANNLGVAYLSAGNKAAAKQMFERVLALQPGHPTARSNLEKTNRPPPDTESL